MKEDSVADNSQENIVGAIDWGGTKLLVGLVNNKGEILASRKLATPSSTPESILETAAHLLDECIVEEGLGKEAISSVGVTVPGPVDMASGLLKFAPAHAFRDVPVAGILSHLSGKTVKVINDVNACALAEQHFGVAKGIRDFLWVTVSTGIGGALVLNGSLYYGSDGLAGEIGHIVVDERGPLCGCGNRGCLEMMASGSAIARMASEQGLSAQDAAEVARLAFQGNPLAVGIMHRAQQALANGIAATINVINPSLVVFGGGVSESLDLALIESLARKSTFTSKGRFPNLAKTALGMQAALIGAASLCFN